MKARYIPKFSCGAGEDEGLDRVGLEHIGGVFIIIGVVAVLMSIATAMRWCHEGKVPEDQEDELQASVRGSVRVAIEEAGITPRSLPVGKAGERAGSTPRSLSLPVGKAGEPSSNDGGTAADKPKPFSSTDDGGKV
eukprot:TRINITY_DN77070_c0_g1_i1.p1 TRINITY_DN77070_c0_g1~~TRINITY_DN77070_c0_g1_i1.p1  ORF type:complete len:136 (+),score=21.76 TRINITY_DN77070_c0_g1_i1:430-837(+)